jgi:hypothetical protein
LVLWKTKSGLTVGIAHGIRCGLGREACAAKEAFVVCALFWQAQGGLDVT